MSFMKHHLRQWPCDSVAWFDNPAKATVKMAITTRQAETRKRGSQTQGSEELIISPEALSARQQTKTRNNIDERKQNSKSRPFHPNMKFVENCCRSSSLDELRR
jgi:hypothetical protein